MSGIVIEVTPEGQIYFKRAMIFDKIMAARDMARLLGRDMLWFVHNSVTVRVRPSSRLDSVFCAWLDSHRSGATEIGPDYDLLLVEKFIRSLGGGAN